MTDTRTQGAVGGAAGPPRKSAAGGPATAVPTAGPTVGPTVGPPVRAERDGGVTQDTAVRPAWRAKLQRKPSGGSSPAGGAPAASSPAAAPGQAARPATQAARPARPRGPRKARLRMTRIDPWSVMKTAFLLSIALAVVTVVSVTIVWSVLGAAGVWESVNASVQQVVGGQDTNSFDIQDYVGMSRVLGFTMLVSVVDVVLITAVATLAAFLYNLSAALLGGIEVTLAEDGR